MTRDSARKKAVRARMAASGEPYSVAARKLAGEEPADDAAVRDEVIARAGTTLAAPGARIEMRKNAGLLEDPVPRAGPGRTPSRPARAAGRPRRQGRPGTSRA